VHNDHSLISCPWYGQNGSSSLERM
jgi:hypothetical protein